MIAKARNQGINAQLYGRTQRAAFTNQPQYFGATYTKMGAIGETDASRQTIRFTNNLCAIL